MAIVFAVFTFEETLTIDVSSILQYIGAIEQFSGCDVRGTTHWVVVKTTGQDGYLITVDSPWLNSDKMYLILHDALYDPEYINANEKRTVECLKKILLRAPPESPLTNYLMSRSDRPECVNLVYEWDVVTGSIEDVRKWIIKNHASLVD